MAEFQYKVDLQTIHDIKYHFWMLKKPYISLQNEK